LLFRTDPGSPEGLNKRTLATSVLPGFLDRWERILFFTAPEAECEQRDTFGNLGARSTVQPAVLHG
jgi:hypothetical protein